MKHIRFFCLLLLLIALPISAVMAELNVVWVRTGVVLESKTKGELGSKFEVAVGQQGTSFETVSPVKLDEKRVLLELAWHPNKSYRFRTGKSITEATSPLKPVPYLIRTVDLDGLLSLMENLQQPAKPTAIAFGHGTGTHKLAVATDRGHLAILHPITGKTLWKTRISEGYVRHITFSPDNTLLYIGEQAVDGFIYCYELTGATPKLRWKYRTADDIETSTPTNPESVYAWVSYPGQSYLQCVYCSVVLRSDYSHR